MDVCDSDGGDCESFNDVCGDNCAADNPSWIGDGHCDAEYPGYHVESCGWDGRDCAPKGYPERIIYNPITDVRSGKSILGNGGCDGGVYNTEVCGWDGGDCIVPGLPDCHVDDPQ